MIKNDENKKTVIDKKERIIEEATVLFYKNGYDNASIRELSIAAGLSVAGVYYFFKDKEEILFCILHQSIIDLNDTIRAAIRENDDPQKNLTRIIESLLRHVIKHKMEIFILNREDDRLNANQKETIKQKRREAFSLMKNELSKLEKQGVLKSRNLTTAIFTIFSMTTWFVRWYDPKGPLTLEEIAAEMADNFFTGVLKSNPGE